MLKNHLKMALRNITGNWLYAGINIIGLGIGLACCLLILLYVRYELSYENSFANAERIYRISAEIAPLEGARLRIPASNNAPVTPALLQDFPQIEQAGRIFGGGFMLGTETLRIAENGVRFADQAILQIFDFDWLTGDPKTALLEPGAIVLTESLARKYFGTADVVGQRIRVSDQFDANITGVIRDLPDNTHLSLSGLVSLNTITAARGAAFLEQWTRSTDFHTYFMLREGEDVATIRAQLPAFIERHVGEQASAFITMPVMNVRDIHLRSDRDEEMRPHGSVSTVYSFAAIAFAVLLIACINFMSIATARSAKRAKEIGMRKTLGASRQELIIQFLGEAMLTALAAMIIAIALTELLQPAFSNFTGIAFTLSYLQDTGLLAATVGLVLFVAFFAGSYPAFFLSGFNTTKVIKGELTRGKQGLAFRNTLVVVQFSIAITLLIATVVILQQRQLATSMDLGFNKDQIVVVNSLVLNGFQQDWTPLKQELLKNPAIEQVTASHFLPFGFNDNQLPVTRVGSSVETRIQYMLVDFDFFETYDMTLLEGRFFTEARNGQTVTATDNPELETLSLVVNESAARALGMSVADSVNARIDVVGGQLSGNIVGVVNDTYFESIRVDVRPLLFILAPPPVEQPFQRFSTATIRVSADAIPQALAHIDATWKTLYPTDAINRHFLDDDFQAMYQLEKKQGELFTYFSVLAILIACFGLFGLASFNAERRTKEIGVRKVMDGSVWGIVLLLTNDFSRLVLLSNLIAWPVAYFAMSRWLENFAYRIDLTPLIFIGSGLIALCIAWVTVGGTAAKAASAKPVLALRYE